MNITFKEYELTLQEKVTYIDVDAHSLFYTNENHCLILDFNICNHSNNIFSYSDYVDNQNHYMFKYKQCYRFYIENEDDLEEALVTFKLFTEDNDEDLKDYKSIVNRKDTYLDNTPLEEEFEQAFKQVYGENSIKYLEKEYHSFDLEGNNMLVDYVIETDDLNIGIEENGVSYHHPQLIGKERYKRQLLKQNSLVHYNFKLYRWSTEHLRFRDKVCDEIKIYFGDSNSFISKKLKAERKFQLYEHQELNLSKIKEARDNGIKSFLVVLPTAAGKSKIVEEDIVRVFNDHNSMKALIIVPSISIKKDWLNRLDKLKSQFNRFITFGDDHNNDIVITTYIGAYNKRLKHSKDYFNYIVVDEAHHAVAPTIEKTIQYYNADFVIGLTATPDRLDKKKLERIFGNYETDLTLQEAIEKGIISPIRAYRVESNLDLSEVRFNGKEYHNADLEKTVRIESRNELIAKLLKKYFVDSELDYKQGIVFCVSVKHAKEMEKILTEYGITAKAVHGSDKNSQNYIDDYNNKKIQFLCACNLINEGWDSPQTSVLVMARPTMSKVLYLQQLGRGLRRQDNKEALYVIDVVDQYGVHRTNAPWSAHSIFGINQYSPFGDILGKPLNNSDEFTVIEGLVEEPMALREIDIFTFEQKYGNYLSIEQLARELFISTGTLRSWIKKDQVNPDVELPFGNKKIQMFNPDSIETIRKNKGLKEHSEYTIKDDFFHFLNEKNYTYSFKMIFILSLLKVVNHAGEAELNDIIDLYSKFYIDRIDNDLKVDRDSCIYTKDFLNDNKKLKQNLLANPFEKYERKRFIYHCKDLSKIAFSTYLWDKLNQEDMEKIKEIYIEHLKEYYASMDGLQNIDYLL